MNKELLGVLNKLNNTQLTMQDYNEWCESYHEDFDKAVISTLGRPLYERAEKIARMDAVLVDQLTAIAKWV